MQDPSPNVGGLPLLNLTPLASRELTLGRSPNSYGSVRDRRSPLLIEGALKDLLGAARLTNIQLPPATTESTSAISPWSIY
jgi:hypothetical protein